MFIAVSLGFIEMRTGLIGGKYHEKVLYLVRLTGNPFLPFPLKREWVKVESVKE